MRTQGGLQIDSSPCSAICEEIGDRLRIMLARSAFGAGTWPVDRTFLARHGLAGSAGTGAECRAHEPIGWSSITQSDYDQPYPPLIGPTLRASN
jgi:hypothetical protein